ncbi:MAG: TrkH family potassium uptake protein [Candidatus Omnitrophica bacterium]|nr:TrkH family potassium uptake protein [Candidatus Omnitrophota bacterium]
MNRASSIWKKFTPYQLIVLGYLLITVIGAFLLSLPISSAKGVYQSFLDALFLATSGISTTGLTVVDVGSYYSLFGQIVLMGIFQIGGIGYMTFIVFMMYLLGVKTSIKTSIVAKESLAGANAELFKKFFRAVLLYTFIFEFSGAVILALFWMKEYSVKYSIYLGIFHSISAFCTAGFSVFPGSLMKYQHSTLVNITIIVVSLAGGIGFFVLKDLNIYVIKKFKRQYPCRLTLHTKIVLIVTFIVILVGAMVIFLSETWPKAMSNYGKMLTSLFQAVSASTTDGFNTIDIGKMSAVSLTTIMFLMFVGASPGSTGGGIKTTTLAIVLIFLYSELRERRSNVFKREISDRCIRDAIVVFSCFMLAAFSAITILTITEKASYIQILFETYSALGNTGLSAGITSNLSKIGRLVLIITMFIGRVGPLVIAYAILSNTKQLDFRYPKEDVFVG